MKTETTRLLPISVATPVTSETAKDKESWYRSIKVKALIIALIIFILISTKVIHKKKSIETPQPRPPPPPPSLPSLPLEPKSEKSEKSKKSEKDKKSPIETMIVDKDTALEIHKSINSPSSFKTLHDPILLNPYIFPGH